MAKNKNKQIKDCQPLTEGAKIDSDSSTTNIHIIKLLSMLDENIIRSHELHHTFLRSQDQALRIISSKNKPTEYKLQRQFVQQPVISKTQLQEFGTGKIAKCFGPEYIALDHRNSPRIPNGDFLMIDRITTITGKRRILKPPASVTAEFDVLPDAWFLSENDYPGLPLSVLMEIALQPCGILSAYLGTSLVLPVENNRFRNLDGYISFNGCPNLSGKTIINKAVMLDSFSSGGMHIQKYSFKLFLGDIVFLSGESSFGYFTKAAMEQQVGLEPVQSSEDAPITNNLASLELNNKQRKHLNLVDNVRIFEGSGKHGNGIILGEKRLTANEWFFANHFYQDPVMPGSLGLEAIIQGLWLFIKHHGYNSRFNNPALGFSGPAPFIWKYRGQVIPSNQVVKYQIYLKGINLLDSSIVVSADADFWVDGTRIYAFENINLTLREE